MAIVLDRINSSADVSELNIEELKLLADELRSYILNVVSKNGGHLAPNLGVIELTVALHKFLDLPNDELVWDVGHQCYAHKILSGRQKEFETLRQFGGLSGFPKPNESPCDPFVAGHSSTSISVAVALSQAAEQNQQTKNVVAVIGDGAMTGGMVYEALNHGGDLEKPFIVILNDNEMSIAENVGSMSRYLTRLRADKRYRHFKQKITHRLLKMPKYGQRFKRRLERFRDSIKYFLVEGVLFEEMGFVYLGPIDGHDIEAILDVLGKAKEINKPTLIHVVTKKGKGYKPAEDDPTSFHGTGAFDLSTGKTLAASPPTYTKYFSQELLRLADADPKIVGITAAMADGTGLMPFAQAYPKRFYDVGIAEPHALTFAGAMAARGLRPIVALYSTFLQRGFDQILHDICLPKSPVVLAVDRAGIVGEDGETHQGMFDLAILRQMPNMTILAPRDGENLQQMLAYAFSLNQPVALRYPRGKAADLAEVCTKTPLEYGKGQILLQPDEAEIGILALGSRVGAGLELAKILAQSGVKAAVADLRFAKPLDEELICSWAKLYGKLAILEDGIKNGGVGSGCLGVLQTAKIQAEVELMAFPDEFIPQGKVDQLFEAYSLLPGQMANKIKALWFE